MAGHIGDEGAARAALDDDHPSVRASGLVSLARLGALTAIDSERVLRDASDEVLLTACELAPALPNASYASLLGHGDRVVEAACFALGEVGDRSSTSQLCEIAAHHENPLCRESAVAALGAIGDPRAKDTLIAALADVAHVRRRAVIALAAFDDRRIEEALREKLSDRDWQVRQAAEDVLGLN